ncbi:MAG: phosphoadenosine phosphosulfate reductase family protein [Oscillospiraceae bacterium]|nr:phosphoadenosine phosphosulfate reductase family protein [Oscillospiraceae bacterium]
MSLIEHTLFGKVDKVQKAIERIKMCDPISNGYMDEPYYTAYSGGKDSDVLRILFELSGVRYDLVHNHTTVDAPETVYYIRSIPGVQISKPYITMWELIVKKRIPPTRIARYCCEHLKERGGQGRFVATGVRWAESINRRNRRGSLEIEKSRKHIILNADNDNNRRLYESCMSQGKTILNPIIDWTDEDVWEFLHHHGCRSNPLYECGYKRVGCIGCPMVVSKKRIEEFSKYPKYKNAYIRAFDKMIVARRENGLPTEWQTGEDVFNWWVTKPPKANDFDGLQMGFLDYSDFNT